MASIHSDRLQNILAVPTMQSRVAEMKAFLFGWPTSDGVFAPKADLGAGAITGPIFAGRVARRLRDGLNLDGEEQRAQPIRDSANSP
jgi:hypothetical protein